MLEEVAVIPEVRFGISNCARSNALCVTRNLTLRRPTKHITRINIHSNENVKEALVVTCDVVVGLVLCKSNEGSHVVFLW